MTLLVNVIRFYFNYHCLVGYLDFYLEIYMFLFQELYGLCLNHEFLYGLCMIYEILNGLYMDVKKLKFFGN